MRKPFIHVKDNGEVRIKGNKKIINLEAELKLGKKHKSICYGLSKNVAESIGNYASFPKIDAVALHLSYNGELEWVFDQVSITEMTHGDDGTDAFFLVKAKDYSNKKYDFYDIDLCRIYYFPQFTFVRWSGEWKKEKLQYLILNLKVWIR